ncbi:hypothetical protein HAX54_050394, partial [Datura stramonium]|nr:hypothetical protein [Datura stramonium]
YPVKDISSTYNDRAFASMRYVLDDRLMISNMATLKARDDSHLKQMSEVLQLSVEVDSRIAAQAKIYDNKLAVLSPKLICLSI